MLPLSKLEACSTLTLRVALDARFHTWKLLSRDISSPRTNIDALYNHANGSLTD